MTVRPKYNSWGTWTCQSLSERSLSKVATSAENSRHLLKTRDICSNPLWPDNWIQCMLRKKLFLIQAKCESCSFPKWPHLHKFISQRKRLLILIDNVNDEQYLQLKVLQLIWPVTTLFLNHPEVDSFLMSQSLVRTSNCMMRCDATIIIKEMPLRHL